MFLIYLRYLLKINNASTISIYTFWCGWCIRLQKEVFFKPVTNNYINKTGGSKLSSILQTLKDRE